MSTTASTTEPAIHQRRSRERRHSRLRRWWIAGSVVLAVVLIALAAGIAARTWLNSQWYVAINGSAGTGTVGVYQGIQGSLLGAPLSKLWSDSRLQVGTLPYFDQELVSKGIPAANEADAQRIVAELQSRAADCQTAVAPAGCPGSVQ